MFYICLEIETYDHSAKVMKRECVFDSTNRVSSKENAARLFHKIYGLKGYGFTVEKVLNYIWEEEEFITLKEKYEST